MRGVAVPHFHTPPRALIRIKLRVCVNLTAVKLLRFTRDSMHNALIMSYRGTRYITATSSRNIHSLEQFSHLRVGLCSTCSSQRQASAVADLGPDCASVLLAGRTCVFLYMLREKRLRGCDSAIAERPDMGLPP